MGNTLSNTALFRPTEPSYEEDLKNLVYIPELMDIDVNKFWGDKTFEIFNRDENIKELSKKKFPALFLYQPKELKSKHTIMYFHSNSCDLGQIYDEMVNLYEYLHVNILAIEYVGFGLCYLEGSTNQYNINRRALAAYNFLISIHMKSENILLFGRSIGTGVATKLAYNLKLLNKDIAGIILHSPYISIEKLVEDYITYSSYIIENIYDNLKNLSVLSNNNDLDTPLLIIHGKEDEVINVYHSEFLIKNLNNKFKIASYPEDSYHNYYYVIDVRHEKGDHPMRERCCASLFIVVHPCAAFELNRDVVAASCSILPLPTSQDLGVPIKTFLDTHSKSRLENCVDVIVPKSFLKKEEISAFLRAGNYNGDKKNLIFVLSIRRISHSDRNETEKRHDGNDKDGKKLSTHHARREKIKENDAENKDKHNENIKSVPKINNSIDEVKNRRDVKNALDGILKSEKKSKHVLDKKGGNNYTNDETNCGDEIHIRLSREGRKIMQKNCEKNISITTSHRGKKIVHGDEKAPNGKHFPQKDGMISKELTSTLNKDIFKNIKREEKIHNSKITTTSNESSYETVRDNLTPCTSYNASEKKKKINKIIITSDTELAKKKDGKAKYRGLMKGKVDSVRHREGHNEHRDHCAEGTLKGLGRNTDEDKYEQGKHTTYYGEVHKWGEEHKNGAEKRAHNTSPVMEREKREHSSSSMEAMEKKEKDFNYNLKDIKKFVKNKIVNKEKVGNFMNDVINNLSRKK
ncbi:alpha/beta hydrolase, putative [Plasmodium ovale curtisi]|uniref:Alpha/beta hydrolase, putative n=1 Tax=Plasmodium ovale curtisi TaxID=864141 RepID=A0A1A8VMW5_PLAOA|nr:alpha/beta hydrolase, putative [Plasmodium ovale curtisi]